MLPLQVVKDLGQLGVRFGIAARKQQTHRWYLGIGISRKRLVWQKETGPAPRFLPCFRSAGVAGVAIGAGGVNVGRRRLSGWGLGIGGNREAARRNIYDSFSFGWKVAVGEQGGGLGRVHRDPMHQALYEASIPIFVQEPEANLGVMHEGMCVWVGEDELEKFGGSIQATNASLKVFDLLIIHMRSNRQATIIYIFFILYIYIRAIGSWVEAWQAAVVVDSAVPFLRRKLTHRTGEGKQRRGSRHRMGMGKWTWRNAPRVTGRSNGKKRFFLQSWRECSGLRVQLDKQRGSESHSI